MEVTIGAKYQIVIPKEVRKKVKGIRPGNKLAVVTLNDKTVTLVPEKQDWLERTRGMMARAWKGIDTTKYLEDLRNEWDEK